MKQKNLFVLLKVLTFSSLTFSCSIYVFWKKNSWNCFYEYCIH